jgi:hypothetical protein
MPRRNSRIGAYLTLKMLTHNEYLPADLINILTKFRRSDVVRWITAVSGWITAEGGMNIENQVQMAEIILSDELQRLAVERINREGDIFCLFHRRQVLFILQFALLVCKEDVPEYDDETVKRSIGQSLLMASDILAHIENDHKPDIGDTPEEVNLWVTLVHTSLLAVRDRAEILARAQSFWFDLPRSDVILDHMRRMEVKSPSEAFKETYSLELREFFMIILCIYHQFEMHINTSKSPLRFEVQGFLKPYFSQETIDRTLALVSADLDTLAYKLISEPRQNWASDLQALRERPMLRLSQEHVVCPDFGLLYRCLTDRVYFLLERAYEKKTFSQLFGYIFEEYINGLIRQFPSTYEGSILARTFYASPYFKGTNDQAGDGILIWGDTAILMEFKGRLLTTRERHAGIPEVLIDGIDDIVGKESGRGGKKGIVQLAKNLKRLLGGEKIVSGSPHSLDLSKCTTIYPIIVAYEDAVAIESVRQYADANFRSSLNQCGVEPSAIGPLLIFSAQDFETLESLVRKIPANRLLAEYAAFIQQNPKERLGNFRTFAFNKDYGDTAKFSESWVGQTQSRVLSEVLAELDRREAAIEDKGHSP